MKFVVCTNWETVCSGTVFESERDKHQLGLEAAARAAIRAIESAGHSADCDAHYDRWHGGRYDGGPRHCGLVWSANGSQAALALAERADAAYREKLSRLEEIEEKRQAEWDAEQAAERTAEVLAHCRAVDAAAR